MLLAVLKVLKIIGIVILIVLAIILALILIILFVPVRYRVDGMLPDTDLDEGFDAEKLWVKACFSWLLYSLPSRDASGRIRRLPTETRLFRLPKRLPQYPLTKISRRPTGRR